MSIKSIFSSSSYIHLMSIFDRFSVHFMSIFSNFGSIFALFHLYIVHMFYEPLEEKVRLIEQSKMPDFKRKRPQKNLEFL